MSGKKSRNKGARGERDVIQLLQPVVNQVYEAFDLEIPKLQRNTLQSDSGGVDIAGLEWIALEIKWQESNGVNGWWKQCLEQAGQTKEPVLIYKSNRVAWSVRMHGCLVIGNLGRGETTCVPVTISIDSFLVWFRRRLTFELRKSQGLLAST